MEHQKNLKEAFEEELDTVQATEVLSIEYRRKKILMWTIRTCLALIIFIGFGIINGCVGHLLLMCQ